MYKISLSLTHYIFFLCEFHGLRYFFKKFHVRDIESDFHKNRVGFFFLVSPGVGVFPH